MPITRQHRGAHRRTNGRAVRLARPVHARVAGQRRELRRRKSLLAAAGRDGGARAIGTLVDDDLCSGAGWPRVFAARGRHQRFQRGQYEVQPTGAGGHQTKLVRLLHQCFEAPKLNAIGTPFSTHAV